MSHLNTLTVRQAMARTGFSQRKVYTLVKAGAWASVKGPAQTATIRILESSIEAWFARTVRRAPAAPGRDADASLPPVEKRAFA